MTLDKSYLKELKESLSSPTGQLVAVLRCKQDQRILSGNHRVAAGASRYFDIDIDERARVAGLSHAVMEELCIIQANIQRSVPESERQEDFKRLAEILTKEGVEKGAIARKIIEFTHFDDSYVYRNLPQEFKNPNRVEAANKGVEKRLGGFSPPSYSKGLSPEAGSQTQRAFTKPTVLFLTHLKAAGLKNARGEIMFERDEENGRGQQLTYHADICDDHSKLIVEVEGEGSASKDNDKRKEFFVKKGYWYIEISNALVESEFGPEAAEIIAGAAKVIAALTSGS